MPDSHTGTWPPNTTYPQPSGICYVCGAHWTGAHVCPKLSPAQVPVQPITINLVGVEAWLADNIRLRDRVAELERVLEGITRRIEADSWDSALKPEQTLDDIANEIRALLAQPAKAQDGDSEGASK